MQTSLLRHAASLISYILQISSAVELANDAEKTIRTIEEFSPAQLSHSKGNFLHRFSLLFTTVQGQVR